MWYVTKYFSKLLMAQNVRIPSVAYEVELLLIVPEFQYIHISRVIDLI